MQAALGDPLNQRFVLLSEACLPIYPPHLLWLQLLAEDKARVNACAAPTAADAERRFVKRCEALCFYVLTRKPCGLTRTRRASTMPTPRSPPPTPSGALSSDCRAELCDRAHQLDGLCCSECSNHSSVKAPSEALQTVYCVV